MIPQITEINFPSYATLHQATASLNDMGDKVINAQVKIDGAQVPEFIGRSGTTAHGDDWEVEFLGERYIQPLRKPQAKKDNSSPNSLIDLTFYHWAIYQMKRYFFVALANVQSGTPIVDKYIAPLAVNLPEFAAALADMLEYYFPDGSIYVYKSGGSYINPDFTGYDPDKKYIEIDHTYIWEVLQKTYELFECRWSIVKDNNGNYAIKFGYPTGTEHQQIFQYGHEGGLVSVERQVQDDSIRNQILGRGTDKNLPYMYFKDYERFHPNSTDSAYQNRGIPDPDAIPELENILFTELRDKNFRSYVQGWKVNTHRQASTTDGWSVTWNAAGTVFTESNGRRYSKDTDRMATDWAYNKGATDTVFDPVEYVKDDDSIAEYGLLQGGLENNEEVYPTIQGMTIEVPCVSPDHAAHIVETRADEIVAVEEVTTDTISDGGAVGSAYEEEVVSIDVASTPTYEQDGHLTVEIDAQGPLTMGSKTIEIPEGSWGNFMMPPSLRYQVSIPITMRYYDDVFQQQYTTGVVTAEETLDCEVVSWGVYSTRGGQVSPYNMPPGTYYISAQFNVPAKSFTYPYDYNEKTGTMAWPDAVASGGIRGTRKMVAACQVTSIPGEVVPNTDMNHGAISSSASILPSQQHNFTLYGSMFNVPEGGASIMDCPTTVTPGEFAVFQKTLKVYDPDQDEYVDPYNIPQGRYQFRMVVVVTNTDSTDAHTFTVSLGPAMLYYKTEVEEWKPTFDVWIKNIFENDRADYESDDEYRDSVWGPLRSTEDMAVTFTTGNLSSHSDWEFKVHDINYDNGRTVEFEDGEGVTHEVRSEWRLTLIKSDAEADSIHKYVPYKNFNAAPLDRFFFTGIELPWAYVYDAEERLNEDKTEALNTSKDVQPTWVASVDRIRLSELNMLWSINPGDKVHIKDPRFTDQTGLQLYVTSVTYTWQGEGALLPDIEYVFSDKVETALTTVERIQGEVKQLSSAVRGLSNLERAVRSVGDEVYLRKDGFEDTTYSPTRVAKTLSSENYRAGIVGGQGWSADIDENGDSIIEVDKLLVRKEMQVNDLVINQITAMGGKEILSAASMKVSAVEVYDDGIVCYFDQKTGTVANLFAVGDIAFSQVFDPENQQLRYYKRRVDAVGTDNIKLTNNSTYINGSGIPAVGDVICQYGSYTNANRRYVIIRDVIGGGYERMLSGLDSVTATGNEYYFAGVQSNAPRWFVGNSGGDYAEWSGGTLTIRGDIRVKGSDNSYYALGYLADALPPDDDNITTISGGVVLSKIIGVQAGGNLVAGLNASALGEDSGSGGHGKLMIFAGAADAQHVSASPFRVYADGAMFATMGTIGGWELGTDHIKAVGPNNGAIELNSSEAKMIVYNSSNNLATQMDGTHYGALSDIINTNNLVNVVSAINDTSPLIVSTSQYFSGTVSFQSSSDRIYSGTLSSAATITLKDVNLRVVLAALSAFPVESVTVDIYDGPNSRVVWQKTIPVSDTPSTQHIIPITTEDITTESLSAGVHVIYFRITVVLLAGHGIPPGDEIDVACEFTERTKAVLGYAQNITRLFGNGLVLSQTGLDYFAAMGADDGFEIKAESGDAGLEIYRSAMRIKVGGIWYRVTRNSSGYLVLTT